MSRALTKRQHEILEYIEQYIKEHDYAPSFREIAEYFAFSSVATVAEHIETLKRKGYLTKDPLEARSIKLLSEVKEAAIPLLGTIAAGYPIEAIQTAMTIDIPHSMAGPNVFALKVRGESMKEDGILDGDFVIIEQIQNPRNGDIIVALLENSAATLKRFYKEKNRIRLQPANSAFNPIFTRNLKIQGKVKGLIRKFV